MSLLRSIREAQFLLRTLSVSKPEHIDLEAIAASIKILARYDELEGCDARLVVHKSRASAIATINITIPEVGRKRFALAHEIGHFVLHRREQYQWGCTESDFLDWYHGNGQEPEANAFAAELLMPDESFRASCIGGYPGFSLIGKLAADYKTSLTSTAIRFSQIGNYPCAIISVHKGNISWIFTSADFTFQTRARGERLDALSAAGDYFLNQITPASKPEPVDPTAWLVGAGLDRAEKVWEETIAMPNYSRTLSIVWIK